ncbi:MAG TPA: hypothetical protein DCE42_10705 [Myxococcales bacterium]|nr:hypothetical protein [Deltaproteobacteria bacterium]HAA55216.1 hypothetical protein [Myxococcales bacterium]
MKRYWIQLLSAMLFTLATYGHAHAQTDPALAPPPIDLSQVNAAFHSTGGRTLAAWARNFEQAVNEIYMQNEFVRVDVRRPLLGQLRVYGYIEQNRRPGYQIGDALLFRIVQYRGVHRFSYRMYNRNGWLYTSDYYRTNRPFFRFAFVGPRYWHRYYTRPRRLIYLRRYRRRYRSSRRYRRRARRYRRYRRSTRARRRAWRRRRRVRRRVRRRTRRRIRRNRRIRRKIRRNKRIRRRIRRNTRRRYRRGRKTGGKW